jgi:hypothetical protein
MPAFILNISPPQGTAGNYPVKRAVRIVLPSSHEDHASLTPFLMTPREVDESVDKLIAELNKLRVSAKSALA